MSNYANDKSQEANVSVGQQPQPILIGNYIVTFLHISLLKKLFFAERIKNDQNVSHKVVVPPLLTIIIISVSVMSLLGISFSAATFIDICQRYYTSF